MFLLLPAVPAAVAAIAMDWRRAHQPQSETLSWSRPAQRDGCSASPTRVPSGRRTP
jgi:hypothetical protein